MIIGIAGVVGAGKDTVAKMLQEEMQKIYHLNMEIHSPSEPLKDFVANMLGLDRDLLEGVTAESRKWREETNELLTFTFAGKGVFHSDSEISPRLLLQRFGTDLGRQILGDDVWIDAVLAKYRGQSIIVPGCRFHNELQKMDITILVKRGEVSYSHQSEKSHQDWHYNYIIQNDGSFQDLQDKVSIIVNDIICKNGHE